MANDRLLTLQRGLIGAGVLLLAVWAGAWLHRAVNQEQDIAAFEAARQQIAAQSAVKAHAAPATSDADGFTGHGSTSRPALPPNPDYAMLDATSPDQSLWSPARVEHYQASLEVDPRLPEALLRIPQLDLVVPVLTGTDEVTLNRAVGRIPGTARIGKAGNLGIAGHRDGFFRGLKDIGEGARIELITLHDTRNYRISDIWIVDPDDISVLQPTDEPSITLVTCYPFYFVGHAPQRYIVRAVLTEEPPI